MKGARLQAYRALFATVFLVAVAVLCRYIIFTAGDLSPFVDKLLNYIRIFIYIGIFSVWGVMVSRRVIQRDVRRMLQLVSVLMVFWLVLREFRFRYVLQPDLLRHMWYMYYIPLLVIPLLALYISVFLGTGEAYKMPRAMWLFCVPTTVFIVLVLTNDCHQFAFRFSAEMSDVNYSYGWLYYAVTAWVYFCSLFAFAVMMRKLRIPSRNRYFPFIPFTLAVLYGVLYAVRVPFVTRYLGDLTVVFCLIFAGFFESCIACGLIPSNSRYFDLFTASVNTPVQILDSNFNVRYAATASEKISPDDVERAIESPVLIDGAKRLHAISVKGGYAVWTEDISQLISLRETLTERREELGERGALLQLEYEREKEHQTVAEKNRLYDLLQSKTQSQLGKIDACMQQYQAAESDDDKYRILAHIVVYGAFIKRRKDFVLSMESADEFPREMLESALAESYRALRLLGIRGGSYIDIDRVHISGETLALSYDFFEDVAETVLDSAKYINLRLTEIGGALRISILTDCAADMTALIRKYPDLTVINDDGSEFILPLEGGDRNA